MIFLTVGTQFPFDRLVKAVDFAVEKLHFPEEIIAQTGDCEYVPRNFNSISFIDKSQFDKYIKQSSAIISHAGMGSIKTAFIYSKPLLVMPRRKKYNEVVNDHQLMLAERFAKLGYLLMVTSQDNMAEKIQELKLFVPRKYTVNTREVVARISKYLDCLAEV